MEIRKKICPVFEEIVLDEEECRKLPEEGVPQQILDCAVPMKAIEHMNTTAVGPASLNYQQDAPIDPEIDKIEDEDNGQRRTTKMTKMTRSPE